MVKPDAELTAARARYDFACRAREVELDLFWKRSLFFWGFIGAAFVAFITVRENVQLSVLVASFGLVCSFVLTLANRGSKFWYENWEQKVERSEIEFTGAWFSVQEASKPDIAWFRARRFSVSKLAIALSDYLVALWLLLLISRVGILMYPTAVPSVWRVRLVAAFGGASIAYALLLLVLARSKQQRGHVTQGPDA